MPDQEKRMIELAGVTRRFVRGDGVEMVAVNRVSLVVPEGQFVCLVGTSGCGKSTLLQMVAGLLAPTDGDALIDGVPITGPGPDRGFVFQKDSVFPWMRVIDNVEYGLKCRGVSAAERRPIALKYLDRVGLAQVANSWPRELSGGMLRRVAIATVFANGGKVLMLDEPFGALDYVTRHQLHEVLIGLWRGEAGEQRRTVLFVTHDVDEALALADRIVVMSAGSKVDDFPVDAARPRTPDSLATGEMIAIKHRLLGHLGIDRTRADAA